MNYNCIIEHICIWNVNNDLKYINNMWNISILKIYSKYIADLYYHGMIEDISFEKYFKKFTNHFYKLNDTITLIILNNKKISYEYHKKLFNLASIKKYNISILHLNNNITFTLFKNIYKQFTKYIYYNYDMGSTFKICKFLVYNEHDIVKNVLLQQNEFDYINNVKSIIFLFDNVGYVYCYGKFYKNIFNIDDNNFDYIMYYLCKNDLEKINKNKCLQFMFKREYVNVVKYFYHSILLSYDIIVNNKFNFLREFMEEKCVKLNFLNENDLNDFYYYVDTCSDINEGIHKLKLEKEIINKKINKLKLEYIEKEKIISMFVKIL